jgi:cation diffusion facilitator CzcD-associated flavoprotein CzcO
MTHIVVIGAGQAGSSLVVKLRNLGFDGRVTLIGAENAPPYQRPPLSKKYLLGESGFTCARWRFTASTILICVWAQQSRRLIRWPKP